MNKWTIISAIGPQGQYDPKCWDCPAWDDYYWQVITEAKHALFGRRAFAKVLPTAIYRSTVTSVLSQYDFRLDDAWKRLKNNEVVVPGGAMACQSAAEVADTVLLGRIDQELMNNRECNVFWNRGLLEFNLAKITKGDGYTLLRYERTC